jgi:hypothetical protein
VDKPNPNVASSSKQGHGRSPFPRIQHHHSGNLPRISQTSLPPHPSCDRTASPGSASGSGPQFTPRPQDSLWQPLVTPNARGSRTL